MSDDLEEPPAPADKQQEAASGGDLRKMFPGLYPLGHDTVRDIFTTGLVALDTNALFDLYRFNEVARSEYVATLKILGERLWIPHRVAEELLKRRHTVIQDCASAIPNLADALSVTLETARTLIQDFSDRHGLDDDQTADIMQALDDASHSVMSKLNEFGLTDLDPDDALLDDPILGRINELIAGKIGPRLDDEEAAKAEGFRRIKEKTPPGYADANKGAEAVGDYLLWVQTIEEAKRRNVGVLLVSNDEKQDWRRIDRGQLLGARAELIEEMREQAGQPFMLVTVQEFLVYANRYLEAEVSDLTVDQAAHRHQASLRDPDDDDHEENEYLAPDVSQQHLVRRSMLPETTRITTRGQARTTSVALNEMFKKLQPFFMYLGEHQNNLIGLSDAANASRLMRGNFGNSLLAPGATSGIDTFYGGLYPLMRGALPDDAPHGSLHQQDVEAVAIPEPKDPEDERNPGEDESEDQG